MQIFANSQVGECDLKNLSLTEEELKTLIPRVHVVHGGMYSAQWYDYANYST